MPRIAPFIAALALATSVTQAAEKPSGRDLFVNHCAACHGTEGEGGGPVAAVMDVTPPNLRTLAQRSAGVFPRDAVQSYVDGREIKAAHGNRQMPIWGDVFRGPEQGTSQRRVRERIEALVDFIASLQYR